VAGRIRLSHVLCAAAYTARLTVVHEPQTQSSTVPGTLRGPAPLSLFLYLSLARALSLSLSHTHLQNVQRDAELGLQQQIMLTLGVQR
jgi:hypothetical protein